MKISTNDNQETQATGNGSLLLVVEASSALQISRYGEVLLRMEFDKNGAWRDVLRENDGLRVRFYGFPKPADPDLRRSSVSMSFQFDGKAPILVTGVGASHDLSCRLSSPAGGSITYFERLFSAEGGIPCVKATSPSGRCLYMAFDGDIRFHAETNTLFLNHGQGRLLFISPEKGSDAADLVKVFRLAFPPICEWRVVEERFLKRTSTGRRAVFMKLPPISEDGNGFRRQRNDLREELFARQSREGGLFLREGPIPLIEQTRAAMFFCADANRIQANAFLTYLHNLLLRYGRIPYACLANGEGACDEGDVFGETPIMILLFCKAYLSCFRNSKRDVFDLIRWAGDRALLALRAGTLPVGNDVSFPSHYRFAGSAKATFRFLAAERFALTRFPVVSKGIGFRISSAVSFVESSFFDRFFDGDKVVPMVPEREAGMHHPHILWGRCDRCQSMGRLIRLGKQYCHENGCTEFDGELPKPSPVLNGRNQLSLLDACLGVGLLSAPLWEELLPLSERTEEELVLSAVAPCFTEGQRKEAATNLLRRLEKKNLALSTRAIVLAACLSTEHPFAVPSEMIQKEV